MRSTGQKAACLGRPTPANQFQAQAKSLPSLRWCLGWSAPQPERRKTTREHPFERFPWSADVMRTVPFATVVFRQLFALATAPVTRQASFCNLVVVRFTGARYGE
jgi:hypothetical protein